jgi:hypothetical protein
MFSLHWQLLLEHSCVLGTLSSTKWRLATRPIFCHVTDWMGLPQEIENEILDNDEGNGSKLGSELKLFDVRLATAGLPISTSRFLTNNIGRRAWNTHPQLLLFMYLR